MSDPIVIVDKTGAEGVWHGEAEEGDVRLVIVEFGGRHYHVPRDSLVEQGEATFLLPLAVDELELAQQVIPIVREEVQISKRQVSRQVRVKKVVREHDETVEVPLEATEVVVERVPKDELLEAMPEVRTEGDVTVIPVVEERLAVTKLLYLVEEVRVRQQRSAETYRETVTLREDAVEVERAEEGGEPRM